MTSPNQQDQQRLPIPQGPQTSTAAPAQQTQTPVRQTSALPVAQPQRGVASPNQQDQQRLPIPQGPQTSTAAPAQQTQTPVRQTSALPVAQPPRGVASPNQQDQQRLPIPPRPLPPVTAEVRPQYASSVPTLSSAPQHNAAVRGWLAGNNIAPPRELQGNAGRRVEAQPSQQWSDRVRGMVDRREIIPYGRSADGLYVMPLPNTNSGMVLRMTGRGLEGTGELVSMNNSSRRGQ
ncbi:MAG: hypothetical protein ACRC7C_12810 [Beijerinckiaceae bacterium]